MVVKNVSGAGIGLRFAEVQVRGDRIRGHARSFPMRYFRTGSARSRSRALRRSTRPTELPAARRTGKAIRNAGYHAEQLVLV